MGNRMLAHGGRKGGIAAINTGAASWMADFADYAGGPVAAEVTHHGR
ncbi:MAG: hypothetical protein JSV91_05785 [Phycisphaerales bacterium]|nr:MAG: hypothetical protein JSV91_05785 [Phycisphaerales bacterium]